VNRSAAQRTEALSPKILQVTDCKHFIREGCKGRKRQQPCQSDSTCAGTFANADFGFFAPFASYADKKGGSGATDSSMREQAHRQGRLGLSSGWHESPRRRASLESAVAIWPFKRLRLDGRGTTAPTADR
jgi:hypothetical protein